MSTGNDSGRKKKIAIIGVSSVFLVAMVVAVAVGVKKSDDKSDSVNSSAKAIQAICQPVDYKEACETSINNAKPNTTDPKELIRIGFEATMGEIKKAMGNATKLKEDVEKDPMAKQALDNCRELMDFAIQDLKNSFNQLGGQFDLNKVDQYMEDLKVWLSGAITYQQTCLDGFDNTAGSAGSKMKEILKLSQQLTSNGLAMITELTVVLKDSGLPGLPVKGGQRKLMSEDELPSWVGTTQRRLLLANDVKPDVTVAKDGSGKYKTINEALKDIPKQKGPKPFVIYVKEGVYDEKVILNKPQYVMFVGDGPTKTKITGKLNFKDGTNTYKTSTFTINTEDFMAKDIGFENSAGAAKHQAVAVRASGDRAVFVNCRFDGYQDTLYAHNHRQFYRDCTITGTIDFVFGDAAVVFQNCQLIVRQPLANQKCIVTAQGRTNQREVTGIVLQNCTISGDPEYVPNKDKNKAYLARPWKEFSRTIIMQSQIDAIIDPEGFLPWDKNFGLDTLYYAEYKNRGPGSDMSKRVNWKGRVKNFDGATAEKFTAAKFLGSEIWIKPLGVPYTPGMISGV